VRAFVYLYREFSYSFAFLIHLACNVLIFLFLSRAERGGGREKKKSN
jgi:hypothetical protein